MQGVTSQILLDEIKNPNKYLVEKNELKEKLKQLTANEKTVVALAGAGDIDTLVNPVKQYLLQ
jgi:UDP-N-acetylmuramate--alanine ligase